MGDDRDFATELRRKGRLRLALAACTAVTLAGLVVGISATSWASFALCGVGCVATGVTTERLERAGWRMPIIELSHDDDGPTRPTRLNHVCYLLGMLAFFASAMIAVH